MASPKAGKTPAPPKKTAKPAAPVKVRAGSVASKRPAKKKAAPPPSVDWEGVERDFRSGQFTLRELEAKFGISYASISRKATAEGWTKDLRVVIRQATDAAILRDAVTGAQKNVTETVLVAAELNKAVILEHRGDIKETRGVASALLAELADAALLASEKELLSQILAGSGAEPADEARARATVNKALSVNTRISSVKQLADAFDKLQLAERRAFGLDEKVERQPNSLADMATDELKRMREALRHAG